MLVKQTQKKACLGVRCEDCIHFEKVPKFDGVVCAKNGIDGRKKAPDCFNPDVFNLTKVKTPEQLNALGKLIQGYGTKQLRILAFVLAKQGNNMNKLDLKFGKSVYFSLGENYLSHFFKGYVVGVSGTDVHIVARIKKCDENTSITLQRDSVLTKKQYKEVEAQLITENKVVMPETAKKYLRVLPLAERLDKKGRITMPEQFKIDYEPPTIDTAPQEWLDIYDAHHKAKNKKSKSKKQGFEHETEKKNERVTSIKVRTDLFDDKKFDKKVSEKTKKQKKIKTKDVTNEGVW